MVKVRVERSGGLTGISSSTEIDVSKLPLSLGGTVRELLDGKKLETKVQSRPRGSADDFNYKIIVQDGSKTCVVDISEFQMDHNMKSLVNYVQNISRKNGNNRN